MSKYSLIEQSLEQNPEIVLAHSKRNLYLPSVDLEDKILENFRLQPGNYKEDCEFFIAPREPVYDANTLNSLMNRLFPIKADETTPFRGHNSGDIEYGWLRFKEKIGRIVYEVEITDTDLDKEIIGKGFKNRKIIGNGHIIRTTTVKMYPDERLAFLIGTKNNSCPYFTFHLNGKAIQALKDGMSVEEAYKKFRLR